MIDDSENRKRQLAFELQNLHVCEKRSKRKKFNQGTPNKHFCLLLINYCSQSILEAYYISLVILQVKN